MQEDRKEGKRENALPAPVPLKGEDATHFL